MSSTCTPYSEKLAAASGCIIEYVGHVAVLAGPKKERRQARDYLDWLLKQRMGAVSVDAHGRDDVVEVEVPRSSVGWITGHKARRRKPPPWLETTTPEFSRVQSTLNQSLKPGWCFQAGGRACTSFDCEKGITVLFQLGTWFV